MTVQQSTIQTDFYKMFHKTAYAEGITQVYSNFTSRSGKLSNVPDNDGVVFAGLQYFIKDVLLGEWQTTFFDLPKEVAINNIKRITDSALGFDYDASHFEDLHDLGYLPLEIKALPEGAVVPYGVAPMTFRNTVDGFQWLPNFLETVMSTENWPIQTSATTSRAYLKNFTESFKRTGMSMDLMPFMCHDFSLRGCFGRHAGAMSGFGHLCSFAGTDTIPAIGFAEKYYGADVEKELVGASVPATEHSTTTSFIMAMVEETGCTKLEAEIAYVRYLMSKVPTGILSHVSDSFDFFAFVTQGLPVLKEEIMARDGKLVIRPDSGEPVKILCGYKTLRAEDIGQADDNKTALYSAAISAGFEAIFTEGKYYVVEEGLADVEITEAEAKGLIQLLWEEFGGTETEEGYKVLDDHIGAIYGDSITLERQAEIIKRLEAKGFVPAVVLGVGSYSYQYVTRDTHGSAVKATYAVKDGKGIEVCKDPATDSKKKSAKGLLRIELEGGKYVQYDQQTPEQEQQGELQPVFRDGKLLRETTLAEIRQRIQEGL